MEVRNGFFAGVLAAVFFLGLFGGLLTAEDTISIKGIVKRIDLEKNIVIITTYDKVDVAITVEDKTTRDHLKKGMITRGDEVICKYIVKDGKNIATYFKKPAGC